MSSLMKVTEYIEVNDNVSAATVIKTVVVSEFKKTVVERLLIDDWDKEDWTSLIEEFGSDD